ncbi:programmed cell death protein 2-like isoform X3 [Lutra lutra]|uniref:programmed cell death protein 2-like isoform X3 n=1 Tax=Lutra lutra TaxID=9657 RepID=UPI001FD27658|nr:programmed cell death protein 2-like isoform X3 [Lutra lutra]
MAAFRKPVLLGLRDTAVHGRPTGPDAWTASKLGGLPDALPAVAAPRPVCERCRQPLALVVQVYCPLEGSPFHRLLHVFACPLPRCGSGGARSSAEDTDCTAQLEDLHLHDTVMGAAPPVSPGEETALPSVAPQFLPYYICVVDEEDYGDFVSLDHAHSLLREYQWKEGVDMEQLLSQSLPSDGDEKYEKTIIKSGDKIFYKFMKRIAACQEQILRYSWSGEPLFLTSTTSEVTEFPACSHCGDRRTFEFQLMPALVSMLRSTNLGLSVEFGTVLIYTCEKSCWPQNHQTPMEELCIVQEDPDESLFK